MLSEWKTKLVWEVIVTWSILGWSGEWAYEARKTERSKGIEAVMSNPASFHEAWP